MRLTGCTHYGVRMFGRFPSGHRPRAAGSGTVRCCAEDVPNYRLAFGTFSIAGATLVGLREHAAAGQRPGHKPAGVATVVANGVAANGGMACVRATGATVESLAGIVTNTSRIPSASGKAARRIPGARAVTTYAKC